MTENERTRLESDAAIVRKQIAAIEAVYDCGLYSAAHLDASFPDLKIQKRRLLAKLAGIEPQLAETPAPAIADKTTPPATVAQPAAAGQTTPAVA